METLKEIQMNTAKSRPNAPHADQLLTWKKLSVLVLLDQSGALDTVDYEILTSRLENWVGLSGAST